MELVELKEFHMAAVSEHAQGAGRLQNVDLNLLYLFSVLYEERNVSRSAERLFLTPSAVSHSLRRLRIMMKDELFTRAPGGIAPTPRANEIGRRLHGILPQLEDVLAPAEFIVSRTSRSFAISCVPYLTSGLIPNLAAAFHKAAPLARLDVRLLDGGIIDELDSGTLDLALGNFRRIPARLVIETLFEDSTLWVMRKDNRNAGKRLTLPMLAASPHVDIQIGGTVSSVLGSYEVRQGLERLVIQNNMGVVDTAFAAAGLQRDVRWTAPDTFSAMMIAAKTNSVALVPASAAQTLAKGMGLVTREPPYVSTPLTIQILSHAEHGSRPATRWLIELVRGCGANANAVGG